jgi:hypothetical protein
VDLLADDGGNTGVPGLEDLGFSGSSEVEETLEKLDARLTRVERESH